MPLSLPDHFFNCDVPQGVPKLFFLVLDLSAVHHVDAMGLHFMEDLIFSTRAKGIQLVLANPNHKVWNHFDQRLLSFVDCPLL